MIITREQLADLQPGDIVEVYEEGHEDVVTRGPLTRAANGALDLGGIFRVRSSDGQLHLAARYVLTVVSRAPRPLYVNHPRTEPVPGDVVRTKRGFVYSYVPRSQWVGSPSAGCDSHWISVKDGHYDADPIYAKPLCLLVDGETGMTVPQ